MTSLGSMKDLKYLVYNLLKENRLYRENDLALILAVCEQRGYCEGLITRSGKVFAFWDRDIVSGMVPRGIMDTVRRTRQRIMEEYPELKPGVEVQGDRLEASLCIRGGVHAL